MVAKETSEGPRLELKSSRCTPEGSDDSPWLRTEDRWALFDPTNRKLVDYSEVHNLL